MSTMDQVLLDMHDGKRVSGRHSFKAVNAGMLTRDGRKLTAAGMARIAGVLEARAKAAAKVEAAKAVKPAPVPEKAPAGKPRK